METNIEIGNEHYLVEEGSQLHGLIQGVNYSYVREQVFELIRRDRDN